MFRSCQIIIRELCCFLLNLYYNIHNLIRFCKQGVVTACHVATTPCLQGVVDCLLGVRR